MQGRGDVQQECKDVRQGWRGKFNWGGGSSGDMHAREDQSVPVAGLIAAPWLPEIK